MATKKSKKTSVKNTNYASFSRRFFATFIDLLIMSAVLSPLKGSGQFLAVLISAAYSIYFLKNFGGTIGKMVLKIKVVKESGGPVSYNDSILRYLSGYLSAIVFLLGYISVLWNTKKQGWHDIIAKTIVVNA